MICGGHHVFVAINMAFTTCGESHQQEWPAYIKGLGGYKNQYTRHSIMNKIMAIMIIFQSLLYLSLQNIFEHLMLKYVRLKSQSWLGGHLLQWGFAVCFLSLQINLGKQRATSVFLS